MAALTAIDKQRTSKFSQAASSCAGSGCPASRDIRSAIVTGNAPAPPGRHDLLAFTMSVALRHRIATISLANQTSIEFDFQQRRPFFSHGAAPASSARACLSLPLRGSKTGDSVTRAARQGFAAAGGPANPIARYPPRQRRACRQQSQCFASQPVFQLKSNTRDLRHDRGITFTIT